MTKPRLPRNIAPESKAVLPASRQISIIGGNGSGKSRFMDEMVRLNGSRSYCLSALSAPFPEREECRRAGCIDMLYAERVERLPYMRTDALSELDKLCYMLFSDEYETLMRVRQDLRDGKPGDAAPTRLDLLADLWEHVFSGNRIVRSEGVMMFATQSGDDLIGVGRLSQGEQAVLYYAAAVLYAMPGAVVFIDSPSAFLHPALLASVWNSIEGLRPDCVFVYNSVDVEFVMSRTSNVCLWVRSYDAAAHAWEYDVLHGDEMGSDVVVDLIGTRKPVLFIEGDARHSIDAKLYPLVFADCTVRPLGSCNKVIESTRTFNDLKAMHHLESRGIVDRDRRTEAEVDYLRRKSVMVPDVAEVENLFLLEGVVRAMARKYGRDGDNLMTKVRKSVMAEFGRECEAQALQHIRHRVKREVECRIDARFGCITAMELHLKSLPQLLRPRERYNEILAEFKAMIRTGDYAGVLRVFNHKPMLGDCGIAQRLGLGGRDEYVAAVIAVLKEGGREARAIRGAIRASFHADGEPPVVQNGDRGGKAHNKSKRKNVR